MKTNPLFIFLFLFIFTSTTAFGQRPTEQGRPERKFTGQVIDGVAKTPMIGANVLIKTVTDSLLRGTVTGVDGKFELARPFIPEVKLEITFLGYKTITKIHSMREPVELGELILLEDTKVLGEVLVQGVSVVGEQKGDTTSFNA
ncbi:MAG: TonB-dependent receptor, partial [Bacteroidetes bacterium]|nr:TonB-dependent receptor [Bacteroidota bacterium]